MRQMVNMTKKTRMEEMMMERRQERLNSRNTLVRMLTMGTAASGIFCSSLWAVIHSGRERERGGEGRERKCVCVCVCVCVRHDGRGDE